MATDRYSDDHKIVVGGGNSLTIEANTLYNNIVNFNVTATDEANISSEIINITSEVDLNLLSNDNLYIYAGESGLTTGNIKISANAGDPPYIKLDQEKRNVILSTVDWAPSSPSTDVIYMNTETFWFLGGEFIISGSATSVSISPSDGVAFSPGQNLNINTPEFNVNIDTLNFDADVDININCPTTNITGLVDININCPTTNITGLNESGTVLKVSNTGRLAGVGTYQTDVMELNFNPSDGGVADEYNNWILFTKESDTKGSIEGYQSTTGSYTNKVFSPFTVAINSSDYFGSGLYTNPAGPTASFTTTTNSDFNGYVVYKSGNQDYGEWIEIGSFEEWNIDKSKLNIKNKIIGFQEGTLVYVRDSKFWRNSPGTPMVVTNRSIVVGNTNYKDDSRIGEVLSFIGQVPVIVIGPVKDGDLLIPKDKENYCIGINKDEITFSQYKNCIGTAWSSLLEEKLGFVNCAIGIK